MSCWIDIEGIMCTRMWVIFLYLFFKSFSSQMVQECCTIPCQPWDCQDILERGDNTSGVYRVYPGYIRKGFNVWCDMETDGGGWLLFQRRQDESVNFTKNFKAYHRGFGDVSGEHWLGNRYLHILTSLSFYELRIDLIDWEGNTTFGYFDTFKIADSSQDYALAVHGHTNRGGEAGDAFINHRGQRFSSTDLNSNQDATCADKLKSSWWFLDHKKCADTNLNGIYHNNTDPNLVGKGVIWKSWRGKTYSLKGSEMKIRSI